jgi:hypothetical protein
MPIDKTGWLPAIRETFAGLIAIVFATTFLILVYTAYQKHADTAAFDAIKELITIVNGLVGIIVGYYFSRMTTEARAEKAEATADKAADAAGKSTEVAANAMQKEREATSQLTRLTDAAREVLPTDPGGTQVRSAVAAAAPPDPAALARLHEAIREAERMLGR